MSPQRGDRLGAYEIVSLLGAGGMGEVYLARDATLGREVAVKVLPSGLASDPARLARFEREARLLASLNHPNIATVHGFEKSGDARFLVMELVPGDTLAQRLTSGPLPVEEALPIFLQIAEGLEAAHESGVVHRDLKPSNIKVTPEGRVKILDFGLAKVDPSAAERPGDPSLSPTLSALATQRGEIMGTVAYMSPEQARGRPTDRRTDIWSFGCVMFETLAEARPFTGETATDIMAAIVKEEPDWKALPGAAPPGLVALIRRCLQKDSRARLRDVGDARLEIARLMAPGQAQDLDETVRTGAAVPASGVSGAAAPPYRRALAGLAAALLAGAALGAWAMWRLAPRERAAPPAGVVRLSLEAPPGILAKTPRISPDGRTVLFYGAPEDGSGGAQPATSLYVRPLGAWESRRLEGTEGAYAAAFSPDGAWLAVARPVSPGSVKRHLVKIPLDGGAPPLALAEWSPAWSEAWQDDLLWLPDGDILVATTPPVSLVRIRSDGSGEVKTVKLGAGAPQTEITLADVLPGGRRLLATSPSWEGRGFHHKVFVIDAVTGELELLLEEGDKPRWSATGHVLFTRRDTLLAAALDPEGGPPGPPVAVARGLRLEHEDAGAWFHVAHSGPLVYQPGGHVGGARRLTVVDRSGKAAAWSEDRLPFVSGAKVSPDGRRLVIPVMREDWLFTVWTSEVDRPRLRLLAAAPDMDCDDPVWHPSGESVVYACVGREAGAGIYAIPAGGGEPRRILRRETPGHFLEPTSISPDGAWLIFQRAGGAYDLIDPTVLLLPLGDALTERPESAAKVLLTPEAGARKCQFSPDGRWIAYVSAASGRSEIHVRPFSPAGEIGASALVALAGGADAQLFWSGVERDGASVLVYESAPGRFASVRIRGGTAASVSEPEPAYDVTAISPELYGLSPLPDGRLLAIQRGPEEAGSPRIHVILNWSDELRRPAAKTP